jgi:hypothetical protein
MRSQTILLAAGLSLVALSLKPAEARADDVIIKRPGAHPNYDFEAEPHLLLAPFGFPGNRTDGFGLGFRGTVVLVDNGFVPKINNSVGLSFGLDWVAFDNDRFCNNNGINNDCDDFDDFSHVWLPVVMQWNFFLSRNWSLMAEPGMALSIGDDDIDLDPFVLYLGGRWHFSDSATLTMRFGYPTFSVGVSFLL